MAAVTGFFKKDRGVSQIGAIASAGANQGTAAAIPYPTSVGLARSQDILCEITGTAFANLPSGANVAVGDMIVVYTKAGATPTINCAVGDTLVGGAQVYAANSSHSFRVVELAAGVATWIVEK
jgi:hypothetical protein